MKSILSRLVLLALATFAPVAAAGDGKYLIDTCADAWNDSTEVQEAYNFGWCLGTVNGVIGTLVSHSSACPPVEASLNQFVRVVNKFLEQHPNDLHKSDYLLAALALQEAYPCK